MEKWFNVGKIVNTHGLQGEVRVISQTDFEEERYKIGNSLFLFQEGQAKPLKLTITSHRKHKNFDLLKFEGYYNMDHVVQFKGSVLKVPESQLSALDENEYYFHEIIGCEVSTVAGEVIGTVTEILTPGANDVWVIKGEKKKEILIPYIDEIVKEINVPEKKIVIEPMEGLLE